MASKTAAKKPLTVTPSHRREISLALDAAIGADTTSDPAIRRADINTVINILTRIDARFRQHHEKGKKR